MRRPLIVVALVLAALSVLPATSAMQAASASSAHTANSLGPATTAVSAVQASTTTPRRIRAMRWAIRQKGSWYCWGGTRGCFDCSGLVYASYMHTGLTLPRTTYSMIVSWHLVRIKIRNARRGDLMFFGSGHVELKSRWWHMTFGAAHQGTRVTWHRWSAYYHPTMAFRVR